MKVVTLIALSLVALISCGNPDQLTYSVSCDNCKVRYSVGDTVVTVLVKQHWRTSISAFEGELYGIHVDSILSVGAASAMISLGGDVQYVMICTNNADCDLSYVGQVKLPWWANKKRPL